MKKITFLLLFSFIFTLCLIPSAHSEDIVAVDKGQINLLPDTASKEEMQKADKESDKRYAEILQSLSKQPKKPTDVSPQWYYYETKILGVPFHKQQTSYWCGVASNLATIDYNGRTGNVSGSTEYQKQKTIANQTETTEDGSNTLSLRNNLNNYLSDIHYFNVRAIKDSSHYDILWNIIDSNINSSRQPVLCLVKTSPLSYYNGAVYYHYILVDGLKKCIDDSTGQVVKNSSIIRIVDPHYDSAYGGYHEATFEQLFLALKAYYDAGLQAYNLAY